MKGAGFKKRDAKQALEKIDSTSSFIRKT